MAMLSHTAAAAGLGHDVQQAAWQRLGRWVFVLMAALILGTVLVGFIPDSLEKIAAVEAGQRAPFPPVLHVHAVLMGSWVLLLLAQASLVAIRTGILFPAFVVWALIVRRRYPETHKRLMILATLLPLPAEIDRIDLLPIARPESPDLYMLLWALPLLAYDVLRHGRIPRAYLIWVGLIVPLTSPYICSTVHPGGWPPCRS
jgi:hypothetical protein